MMWLKCDWFSQSTITSQFHSSIQTIQMLAQVLRQAKKFGINQETFESVVLNWVWKKFWIGTDREEEITSERQEKWHV